MPVDLGTGATLSIAGATVFTAQYQNLAWDGVERAVIQTSHLGTTTAHSFTHGDLYDPGTLSCDLWWDINKTPPFTGSGSTVSVITLTLPVAPTFAVAGTVAASGFVTGIGMAIPLEDMMTQTVNIKFTGTITFTSATS